MGVQASLSSISLTQVEGSSEFQIGEDVVGMLQAAQTKAQELMYMLGQISGRLPNGDANITAINAIVTALS